MTIISVLPSLKYIEYTAEQQSNKQRRLNDDNEPDNSNTKEDEEVTAEDANAETTIPQDSSNSGDADVDINL